jgi:hypothetical protein
MPGLGIHILSCGEKDVDGRDKPGHDDVASSCRSLTLADFV